MQENLSTDIGTLMEPEPIPFSFEAPGWTALLVLLILVLLIIAVREYNNYLRNAYRRMAIKQINAAKGQRMPSDQIIYKVTEILKRVALTSFGREEQGSLYGKEWVEFLKSHGKIGLSELFREVVGTTLYQGRTMQLSENERSDFINESINWIKKHRV